MAIVFIGKSKCAICDKIIDAERPFRGFPAFVMNDKDQLHIFNDSVVHETCLDTHPLKDLLLGHLKEIDKYLADRKEYAAAKNMQPEDVISWTLLSSDSNECLFKFNYGFIGKAEIKSWEERDTFLTCARTFLLSGKWSNFYGNSLELLVDEIR